MSHTPEAPERIWLQRDDDDSRHPCESEGVTWCEDKINEWDTEYVRADLFSIAIDNATLRTALQTHAEEAARLIQQRDELLASVCRARNLIKCGEVAAALNCLCDAAITRATQSTTTTTE